MLGALSVLCRTEEQSIHCSIGATTEQIVHSPGWEGRGPPTPPSWKASLQSSGVEWGPEPTGNQPTCLASEQSSDRVLGTVGQKRGELDTCPQREGGTAVGEEGMEVGLSVPTAGSAVVEVSGCPPLNRRSEGRGEGPGGVPRPNVQKRDPWVSALESRQPPWAPLGGRCPWRVQRWDTRPPPPPGQPGPQCTVVWGGARPPPPPEQHGL